MTGGQNHIADHADGSKTLSLDLGVGYDESTSAGVQWKLNKNGSAHRTDAAVFIDHEWGDGAAARITTWRASSTDDAVRDRLQGLGFMMADKKLTPSAVKTKAV